MTPIKPPNRWYHARVVGAVFITANGKTWQLDPKLHVRNHSPTGFAWGYAGSGPSQLALAIVIDHLAAKYPEVARNDMRSIERKAETIYQDFKSVCIAKQDRDSPFDLTSDDVENAFKEIASLSGRPWDDLSTESSNAKAES